MLWGPRVGVISVNFWASRRRVEDGNDIQFIDREVAGVDGRQGVDQFIDASPAAETSASWRHTVSRLQAGSARLLV